MVVWGGIDISLLECVYVNRDSERDYYYYVFFCEGV